ncbi:DUF1499 domain-containing protein [Halomonas sp. 18H]|uniref:DUF1499 domain-containing protein n=1 Tax=Halomonas almeriensis TaxID=308163 RepID=UPI0022326B87|nr:MULTISPECIES: DUF1499 domain-containing protein [Halomonas]MCW4152789.1 DUF1499 domain-containing protein [Halomonas sp. 18H]MDN3552011.1 DUF1499 domain-containing protein [Halomonas almeriensis]
MSSLSFKPRPRGGRWPVMFAWLGVLLLVVALIMMAMAGPAYRLEWLSLADSFNLLRKGAHLAVGAGVLGLLTFMVAGLCRRWRPALVGMLVILTVAAAVALPAHKMQLARSVPPIHDITTDMTAPPAFQALAEARREAPNALAYPGDATADQQRAGYPALGPVILDAPLSEVMGAVEATVAEQGWEVARVSATRLEATATTRWFGFADDIVVRLRETPEGVRVDMRSASRIGRSDLGTNASRIQRFLEALQQRLAGEG